MNAWEGSLQRRAWRPYIETSVLLQTRLDEDLQSSVGLSLLEYHLLLILSESRDHRLRMGELATRMVFSPSRLTYQVKTMEGRGWVLRQPSPTDKRVQYAVLTASGLEKFHTADRHHIDTVQRLFTDDLDEHELHVITDVFTRLRARLQGHPESHETAPHGRQTDRTGGIH